MEEQWKKVKDERFPQISVSNTGKIRNDDTGNILKPVQSEKTRYARVCVWDYKNSKRSFVRIHRAVAAAFLPNPENKPELNHISGDKSDNSVSNLEWCTRSENMKHAYRTGICPPPTPRPRPVAHIDLEKREIEMFHSVKDASTSTGVEKKDIYNAIYNKHGEPLHGHVWIPLPRHNEIMPND